MDAKKWSSEDFLRQARELVKTGGTQGRREIVRVALALDRLLEGKPRN